MGRLHRHRSEDPPASKPRNLATAPQGHNQGHAGTGDVTGRLRTVAPYDSLRPCGRHGSTRRAASGRRDVISRSGGTRGDEWGSRHTRGHGSGDRIDDGGGDFGGGGYLESCSDIGGGLGSAHSRA
ncbi:hypothetical protein MTO96_042710 [Rhipicephalus appendiculatus]